MSKPIKGDDLARFWSKTEPNGECRLWTGNVCPGRFPYGKFHVTTAGRRKTMLAHRWIFWRINGYEPEVVRHTCDTPRCVEPTHLLPGGNLENTHDAMERGRRRQALTPDIVTRLRSAYREGVCLAAEARRLGVHKNTALNAALRVTWKHIP